MEVNYFLNLIKKEYAHLVDLHVVQDFLIRHMFFSIRQFPDKPAVNCPEQQVSPHKNLYIAIIAFLVE